MLMEKNANYVSFVHETFTKYFILIYFLGQIFLVHKVNQNKTKTFKIMQVKYKLPHILQIQTFFSQSHNTKGMLILAFSRKIKKKIKKKMFVNQKLTYTTRDTMSHSLLFIFPSLTGTSL